jgi:hypothetical protein
MVNEVLQPTRQVLALMPVVMRNIHSLSAHACSRAGPSTHDVYELPRCASSMHAKPRAMHVKAADSGQLAANPGHQRQGQADPWTDLPR